MVLNAFFVWSALRVVRMVHFDKYQFVEINLIRFSPRRRLPSRVFRLLPRSGERTFGEIQCRFHLMRRDQRGGLGKKLPCCFFCGMMQAGRYLRRIILIEEDFDGLYALAEYMLHSEHCVDDIVQSKGD